MNKDEYAAIFEKLTGNKPFPWQLALFRLFENCGKSGENNPFEKDRNPVHFDLFEKGLIPASCNLPTGLGKTSVIAVWLIALAFGAKVPHRLVYVVNRRTVVDQTTDEVEKYRYRLHLCPELAEAMLAINSPDPVIPFRPMPLALSTLRGQFADNREWSADPSRPAVICGTVDMIGSRLLYSGYGIGMKAKPLHAGFLGQDALLVHDEAHLEPAFQELIEAIESEQRRCKEFGTFKVMALTATPRGTGEVFELTKREKEPEVDWPSKPHEPIHEVWRRTHSKKAVAFHEVGEEKNDLVPKVVELALAHNESEAKPAVLIFVRTVLAVDDVVKKLKSGGIDGDNIETLTGTMRGLEREKMATTSGVFKRFKRDSPAVEQPGTVYLVCTSAGEVGVDMSADHVVCDLSTYDSMAQRFGRVNRYGTGDARIDIVHPTTFESKDKPFEAARERTLKLLDGLRRRADGLRDASPASLGELLERAIREGCGGSTNPDDRAKALREYVLSAFAPPPTILPTTDILFDAWALTTITDKLPGRPKVEPYLHGVTDDDYGTEFAWRTEVELLTDKADIAELLDEFPLKPHETLRVPAFGKAGAYVQLEAIRERSAKHVVWVVESDGGLTRYDDLDELLMKQGKDYAVSLAERTVILPPKAGGLTSNGMLKGDEQHDAERQYDVAGTPPKGVPLRRLKLVRSDSDTAFKPVARTEDWDENLEIVLEPGEDRWKVLRQGLGYPVKPALRLDFGGDADEPADGVIEYLIVRPLAARGKALPAEWPGLDKHNEGVRAAAEGIVTGLKLDKKLAEAVKLAAEWHDLGKGRTVWQRGAGNLSGYTPIAKTLHGRPPENLNSFRHELGSMVDAVAVADFAKRFDALDDNQKDVALHLMATHHGRGRPHFPEQESHDTERPTPTVAAVVGEVPGRFARLQRKYGRWGLAYLESLLRAADIVESRRIESCPLPERPEWPKATTPPKAPTLRPFVSRAVPTPSIAVAVDPTNPGQFFACCGLLELADRLWPGAEGWFADGGREFKIACDGTLPTLIEAIANAKLIHNDPSDLYSSPLTISDPFRPLCVDWWETDRTGAKDLKVWAGTMESYGIALAMQQAMKDERFRLPSLFDVGMVVQNPHEPAKKKEPYYFDARRAPNAHARDVGFSTNDLGFTSTAHPAVEFLCLVGLQVSRPAFTDETRIYDYFLWPVPLPTNLLFAASSGALELPGQRGFRFENWFRTGQRKHKAFRTAIPRPTQQGA